MKLLLTSAGFTNKTIVNALTDLCEKPLSESKLVYVPTAANVVNDDKWWLVDDYNKCLEVGLGEFDILDFSAVNRNVWLERYNSADVLVFGGGNTSHLITEIIESGLDMELETLLMDKVYVGVSAGSHVASKNMYSPETARLYEEKYKIINDDMGLGYVDVLVVSHINSQYFKKLSFENIKKLSEDVDCPIYALDDSSALVVDNDRMEVVSEGTWKQFN